MIQQATFATPVTAPVASLAALQSALTPAGQSWANRATWVNDGKNHLSTTVFDGASRAVFQIDALGDVVERQYSNS